MSKNSQLNDFGSDFDFHFLGRTHSVKFVNSKAMDDYWNKKEGHDESIGVFGYYDALTSTIFIWEGASVSQQQETILHELFHVFEHALGREAHEEFVAAFSRVFFGVMIDNPHIVKHVFGAA